jgi:hypothetical protein
MQLSAIFNDYSVYLFLYALYFSSIQQYSSVYMCTIESQKFGLSKAPTAALFQDRLAE